MSDEPKLLPCPFCGNDGTGPIEDSLHIIFSEHEYRAPSWCVQCDKCTATMGYSESEEEAVEAWNRRVRRPAPAVPDDVAELLRDCRNRMLYDAGAFREQGREVRAILCDVLIDRIDAALTHPTGV